jgi:glutamine synthetase
VVEGRAKPSQSMPERLPRTLIEALDGFRVDPLVGPSLGEEFRDIYLRQKNKEWQRDFYKVTEEERLQMMEYI